MNRMLCMILSFCQPSAILQLTCCCFQPVRVGGIGPGSTGNFPLARSNGDVGGIDTIGKNLRIWKCFIGLAAFAFRNGGSCRPLPRKSTAPVWNSFYSGSGWPSCACSTTGTRWARWRNENAPEACSSGASVTVKTVALRRIGLDQAHFLVTAMNPVDAS